MTDMTKLELIWEGCAILAVTLGLLGGCFMVGWIMASFILSFVRIW